MRISTSVVKQLSIIYYNSYDRYGNEINDLRYIGKRCTMRMDKREDDVYYIPPRVINCSFRKRKCLDRKLII